MEYKIISKEAFQVAGIRMVTEAYVLWNEEKDSCKVNIYIAVQ